MYKYFPNLQNGVDDADVDEIKDAFNEIENDITALQNKKETDPTVPSWAKEPQKPTYTADEVGALPSDTKIPTKISDLENDLMDFAEIQDLVENVGDLDNLTTEDKSNLVNAINELDAKLAEKANGAYVEEIQSQLESDLADEKRERIDADNQFIGVVHTLSETINDVSEEINKEIAEREKADTTLQSQITKTDAKIKMFNQTIAETQGQITHEATAREEADTALSSSLEWKLIGEAQITQEAIDEAGEEGITAITLDLGEPVTEWYGETMIEITIPKADSLNSFSNGQSRVYFGETLEQSLGGVSGYCVILAPQSNGNLLNPTWTQRIIATSIWLNKERLSHSLITYKSYSAASGYITTPYTTENNLASASSSIIGKRYLSVWGFNGSSGGNTPFKFPKNSTLKLYGRF